MQAYLIDSSIYIFRSYFTLPENWQALDSGHSTHAVYGFTAFLLDMLRNKNPEHLFCAFDESLGSGSVQTIKLIVSSRMRRWPFS
jgi:DNA polymerase-1